MLTPSSGSGKAVGAEHLADGLAVPGDVHQ
jgi:hypothetical protein